MEHPCAECGKPTTSKLYCSNACSLKGTAAKRAAAIRKPKPPCPRCGKPRKSRTAAHCSRECADATRREGRETQPCLWCGTTDRSPCSRGPYCSFNCFNEDRYHRTGGFAAWMARWQTGEESGTVDGKPDGRIRMALVALRGQRCEQCGWDKQNPVSGRVPLEIDHIEGDRTKNRPEDLRLLCPNCHALTPTYQHLNNPRVGATRTNPDRRYRETWLDSTHEPLGT